MSRRIFLGTSLAVTVVVAFVLRARDPLYMKTKPPLTQLLIHIPQAVDPEFVSIAHSVRGRKPGEGYSSYGASGVHLRMTATQDIPISLRLPQNEVRATSLRAILFCRGYRLALINIPSLEDVPNRWSVNLVPLDNVPMKGRVAMSGEYRPEELRLDVHFDMTLAIMGYFESMKGIGGLGMRVATTTIAPDGTFMVEVPNFQKDPVMAKWGYPGRFNFGVRALRPYHDASSRRATARIAGRSRNGRDAGIPVAASYPQPIHLNIHWQ
jgi:hypothetical protein